VSAGDRWAVLLHGFTRRGRDLAPLADAFAAQSVATISPDLGAFNWFRSVNNPRFLDRVARDLVADIRGAPVIVGHSAGAAAAAYLATRLPAVSGIVFVDGNDGPTRLIARSWPALVDIPMVAVCAPPSRCNRGGAFAAWAASHGVPGGVVPGMGHGDIEGASGPMYRVICGDASTPQMREWLRDFVVELGCALLNGAPVRGVLDRNSERIRPW